jgi:hypothetical protein
MKTVSENANRNVSDKVNITNILTLVNEVLQKYHDLFQTSNKKSTRKFLQTLQPSGSGKENLVGTGRFAEKKYLFIFRFILNSF